MLFELLVQICSHISGDEEAILVISLKPPAAIVFIVPSSLSEFLTTFTSEEAIYRFAKKLRRMGIDDKLKELGAEEGDQVRILKFYFDFKD